MFSHEFCEIIKSTIFTEHLRTTASGLLGMGDGIPLKKERNIWERGTLTSITVGEWSIDGPYNC